MSNHQLEERQEWRHAQTVARALGISLDELGQLKWRIEDNASDDGALYGHQIYLDEGSDPAVIDKLANRLSGDFISIGPLNVN